jgi:hypothetical protein
MTPEPKDVRLAREIIAILGEPEPVNTDVAMAMANAIVDAHEANIEVGRRQAEEKRLAKEETARRWPELVGYGVTYTKDEWAHTFAARGHGDIEVEVTDDRVPDVRFDAGDEWEVRPCNLVLALIDAAGRNTTADRLMGAIREAIDWIDNGDVPAGRGVLSRAIEASNG